MPDICIKTVFRVSLNSTHARNVFAHIATCLSLTQQAPAYRNMESGVGNKNIIKMDVKKNF